MQNQGFTTEAVKALGEKWEPRFRSFRVGRHTRNWYEFRSLQEFTDEIEAYGHLCESQGTELANDWRYGSLENRSNYIEKVKAGQVTDELRHRVDVLLHELKPKVSELERLYTKVEVTKRRSKYSGGRVNIGRYLIGDPNIYSKLKQTGKKRTISLGMKCNFSNQTSEEQVINVAAATIACTIILERLGYNSEVTYFSAAQSEQQNEYSGYDYFGVQFPLKSANQRADVQNLCAASFPALHRDFGFIAKDVAWYKKGITISSHHGYGNSRNLPQEIRAESGFNAILEADWEGDGYQLVCEILEQTIGD